MRIVDNRTRTQSIHARDIEAGGVFDFEGTIWRRLLPCPHLTPSCGIMYAVQEASALVCGFGAGAMVTPVDAELHILGPKGGVR